MSKMCISCGKTFDDETEYCPYCSLSLHDPLDLPADYFPPEPCEHEWEDVFNGECAYCRLCGSYDC